MKEIGKKGNVMMLGILIKFEFFSMVRRLDSFSVCTGVLKDVNKLLYYRKKNDFSVFYVWVVDGVLDAGYV